MRVNSDLPIVQPLPPGVLDTNWLLTLPLPPQASEIKISAQTQSSQLGEPAKLRLSWAGARPPAPPRTRLLVLAVGVADYPGDDHDLWFPATDAQELATALSELRGYGFSDVLLHGDSALTNGNATSGAIHSGFQWLSETAESNDVSVIYLAGHGELLRGMYHFLPHDANRRDPVGTMFSELRLGDELRQIPGKSLLLLDTCWSGKVLTRGGGERDSAMASLSSWLKLEQNGAVALTAVTSNQEAHELKELNHSAFVIALLEVLRRRPLQPFSNPETENAYKEICARKEVRLSDVQAYVKRRVPDLTGGDRPDGGRVTPTAPSDLPLIVRE
jgi:uncharacterized caspase-like protein